MTLGIGRRDIANRVSSDELCGGYVVKIHTALKAGLFVTFIIHTSPAQLLRRWDTQPTYPGN
jgi:hypothetical protein